jgi:hypothetical protein
MSSTICNGKKVTVELKLTKLHLLGYLKHTLADYTTDKASPMNDFYAVNNKTHQYRKSIPLFLESTYGIKLVKLTA